ncbi:hypothetical protein ISN45_Aa08g032070 [Arabidopsis thaliana x Arabidopsis arenosa]|uniref:Uncharacterized protein n=2 Tax=Arabidopsis TaxID=3701 RepID=A0A8T1Y945_ARASU|nr:hypothetical protein ISN45_Aa08g032070 [Arabidopsis thaliana x Arabidopsis arenosa]KAG7539544.1 hypothetical protein ISN44_As13g031750 [Arabidopsis suecica]
MKTKSSGAGCVPRVRTNSRTAGDREISVTSLTILDRFREAVLRLIMISAVSKSKSRRHNNKQTPTQKYYNTTDTYHSEAVADCIEFIRTKKAIIHQENDR